MDAADKIGSNFHLLDMIFIYLPLSSLFRCQNVSRAWRRYIRDPSAPFQRLRSRSATILFSSDPMRLDYFSYHLGYVTPLNESTAHLSTLFNRRRLRSFDFSYGWVAIASMRPMNVDENDVAILVYNIATRDHIIISTRPEFETAFASDSDGDDGEYDDELMFEHLNIVVSDPSHPNEYKLVYIWRAGYQVRFASYDSATLLWRTYNYQQQLHLEEDSDRFTDDVLFDKAVLWHGKLHWPKLVPGFECLDLQDFETAFQQAMPELPGAVEYAENYLGNPPEKPAIFFFGVLQGDLSAIVVDQDSHTFRVVMMEHDYSEWIPKYNLDLSDVIARNPGILDEDNEDHHSPSEKYDLSVLNVLVADSVDAPPVFVLSIPGKMLVCDSRGRAIKEVHDPSVHARGGHREWFRTFDYFETYPVPLPLPV